jgi:geranylgeranyl diphosphate synthase type II
MLSTVSDTGTKWLDDLIAYHFAAAGARTRARVALLSAQALALPDRTCVALAASCELIHNASLLHDDIQDQDTRRRGQLAAWRQFDVNTAMCAGTLLLSAAYRVLANVPSYRAELITHVHQRTTDLIAGQVADLQAAKQVPDFDAYVQIAKGKSGSLLALPLELSLIVAGQRSSVFMGTAAAEAFAVAYQIIDDIKDHEVDVEASHNNVIAILRRDGMDQLAALDQAWALAQSHLLQASTRARWLPAQCGQVLVDLCCQLQRQVQVPIDIEEQVA